MQILSSVTRQELTRKSLLKSCLLHLLQFFSREGFAQGKHQCFSLNQADLQAVKSPSLRSQGSLRAWQPFCGLGSYSSSHSFKCFPQPRTGTLHPKLEKKQKTTQTHPLPRKQPSTRPQHRGDHNRPYPSDTQPAPHALGRVRGQGQK